MDRPYRDADWLEERYHGDGLTQREIAEECGVVPCTIRRWMKRLGIETREVRGEHHGLYGTERSEEVKHKISETLTDREFSAKARQRMAEARTGESIPPEVREKIAESLRGVQKSDETRRRMSEAKLHPIPDHRREKHWTRLAYGRGFDSARTTVRRRDEVCQVCGHDGTDVGLSVHHIVPLRMFRDTDTLRYRDAHHPGNLVLVCRTCHPRVEWGDVEIEPDFDIIPEEHRDEYQQLWASVLEERSSMDGRG